jgi:hypothetical protein
MRKDNGCRARMVEESVRTIHRRHLMPRCSTAGCGQSAPCSHFHFRPSERLLLHCSPCWLYQQWSAQPAYCMRVSSTGVLRKQLCGGAAAAFVSVRGCNELISCCLRYMLLPCICISSSASQQSMQPPAPLPGTFDHRHFVPSVSLSAEMCHSSCLLLTLLCLVRFPLASPPRSKQHSLAAT